MENETRAAAQDPKPPPSGRKALSDFRPRLVQFVRHSTPTARSAVAREPERDRLVPEGVRAYVLNACEEWLQTTEARNWEPLGMWLVRNGQLGDTSAFPEQIPPEDRLATLSISATLTSTSGIENDSLMVVFEVPRD